MSLDSQKFIADQKPNTFYKWMILKNTFTRIAGIRLGELPARFTFDTGNLLLSQRVSSIPAMLDPIGDGACSRAGAPGQIVSHPRRPIGRKSRKPRPLRCPPVEVDLVRKKGERYTLAHILFRIGDSGRRFISSNNM